MKHFLTKDTQLQNSTDMANELFEDIILELKEQVKNYDIKFKYSNISLSRLIRYMENYPIQMEVKTYWYFSRRVLGKFVPSEPRSIYLNRRTLPRTYTALLSTYYHEYIHALEHHLKVTGVTFNGVPPYFHHGSNRYTHLKESTAPYFVDMVAEKVALGEQPEDLEPRDKMESFKTWHWTNIFKPWRWF